MGKGIKNPPVLDGLGCVHMQQNGKLGEVWSFLTAASVSLSVCPSGRPAPTEADDQIWLTIFVRYVQTNKQTN